jgi:predicted metal-binding protein
LRDGFQSSPLVDYRLQTLHCLGACRQPCTIAFTAPEKWRLRFSRLRPANVAGVLAVAELYRCSPDGRLALDALPPGMADCFSSASPEGLMHARGAPPRADQRRTQDNHLTSQQGATR